MKTKKTVISLGIFLMGSMLLADGYVNVTYSNPITRRIEKTIPVQNCWIERVPVEKIRRVKVGTREVQNTNSNNLFGKVLGGAVGGILGHQVGGGSGKTVATVGGTRCI